MGLHPDNFSRDTPYSPDVWNLCGSGSVNGGSSLWHKEQERAFSGHRRDLFDICGLGRRYAGSCRKQSGQKTCRMDAGKLFNTFVSDSRRCMSLRVDLPGSPSFRYPESRKQVFKKCYPALCRPDHKDQGTDRYREPPESSCKRDAGPCGYCRTDETALPGCKRCNVCSLSVRMQ